jgi:two-component sensor histidine kinase
MLEPRQMNEDRLDVREANHRMMNTLAILLALFHRNFSEFSDQCVRARGDEVRKSNHGSK